MHVMSILTTVFWYTYRAVVRQPQDRLLPSPSSFSQAWDWHWEALHGCAMCSAVVGLPVVELLFI